MTDIIGSNQNIFSKIFFSGELVVKQPTGITLIIYSICFVFRLGQSYSISDCEGEKTERKYINMSHFLVKN